MLNTIDRNYLNDMYSAFVSGFSAVAEAPYF